MANSGHRPAGGLRSRNVKHTTAPKVEPRAHARNPGAVAQYGALVGNHVTTHGGSKSLYRGEPDSVRRGYQNPVGPTSFSNTGVGGGRTIHSSGSQATHGSVAPGNPPSKSTDILNQFGPNFKAPRG